MKTDIYTVFGVEFTKEQYNVLKRIIKYTSISDTVLHNFFTTDTLRRSLDFLEKNHFISHPEYFNPDTGRHEGTGKSYEITDKGVNAFYLICQHKSNYIKDLLLSKWCDILVAFITAAITSANWKNIADFFIRLMT